MSQRYDDINYKVIQTAAAGSYYRIADGKGVNKWWIEDALVHIKTCGNANPDGVTYPFNIGRNSSSADWGIFVCGGVELYYVLPQKLILELHRAEGAYPDRQSPGQRTIFHIDTGKDTVGYSRVLPKKCIKEFRCYKFTPPT